MSEPQRETMIALRATRQAYRVAADILYDEPIDVERVACSSCGQMLDWRGSEPLPGNAIACPACRAVTSVPPHLRSKAARTSREDERFRRLTRQDDRSERDEPVRLSRLGVKQMVAGALLLLSAICFLAVLFGETGFIRYFFPAQ